jgi:hypothetical protein
MIPMNQRNYDWDNEPQISKFLNDLFDIFENTVYCEKMGSLIFYTGNKDGKELWDGQQRYISLLLILKALSIVTNTINYETEEEKKKAINFSNGIINLLKEDVDSMVEIPERIHEFKLKYPNYEIIPKIHCVNPHDNDALAVIFNSYKPLIQYYKSSDEDEIMDDSDDEYTEVNDEYEELNIKCYKCNLCDKKINNKAKVDRETDFVRHLKNCHQYDDNKIKCKDTKIYKAFEYICRKISDTFDSISKIKEFYQFILNHIDINVYECNDLCYVSKIFEWENNRGKPVNTLDVIKNMLLSNINHDKKYEIYDRWNELKSMNHKLYADFGQRIFDCGIQIYNKKISRIFEQEQLFKNLIKMDKNETYNEIIKFFKIVERLISIMENIQQHRYGRLILQAKRCCISWEGFNFFALPVFYTEGKVNGDIIELIAKWLFRNINTKNRIFNNLTYSNDFIELSNKFIKDTRIDYYDAFKEILRKGQEESIKEDYVKNNIIKEWKHATATQAKMLLYFLETTNTPDDYYPNIETHDLEHIYPENKKSSLKSPGIIYTLGNLTLLESKNSKNGHKGNRSIKDNGFSSKKEQYKESSHKITRELYTYNKFEVDEIKKRTLKLFQELDIKTKY